MRLTRRKSRAQQIGDMLGTYVKMKAASKAAKGTRKAIKGAAVYQVAKRTPMVRRLPLFLGAGAAAFFGARRMRGGGHGGATPA
jgi:hypothetical protein